MDCRRCLGCQEKYARQWGLRCAHEAQMHKRNSFLTLTYDQAHAPWRGMVSQRHLRLMVKRCRNAS